MLLRALSLAAILGLTGAAQPARSAADCTAAGPAPEDQAACLAEALGGAETEMAAALADAGLETRVADTMAGAEEIAPRLAEAQRLWRGYRDAHCGLEAALTIPARWRPVAALTCRLDLTQARAAELRATRARVLEDDCNCTRRHQQKVRSRLRRIDKAADTD